MLKSMIVVAVLTMLPLSAFARGGGHGNRSGSSHSALSVLSRPLGGSEDAGKIALKRVFGAILPPIGDDELAAGLADNEVATFENLRDRQVAFLGSVESVRLREQGYVATFRVGNQPSLDCEMARREKRGAMRLLRGRSAVVTGRFITRGHTLVLVDCRVSYAFDEDPVVTARSAELCMARVRAELGEDMKAFVALVRKDLGARKALSCSSPIILVLIDCDEHKAAGKHSLLSKSCERLSLVNILNELIVDDSGTTRRASGQMMGVAPSEASALYKAMHGDVQRE